ncbi:MAG TPA: helix-hairpin-helix domain-containing protein, partial [bacterium]|nr:helix-hairpin-helix domain-containing protein [bacterium]
MNKQAVSEILEEMSVLLELSGENPFKVRAYSNAARAVEAFKEDLHRAAQENRLTQIKGIGKNIAEHVAEILATGGLKELNDLREGIPGGVIEMLSIPGLGPKRVRFLWHDIGVKTVGELEMACKRHLLAGRPGFGERMEAKILEGIESQKKFAEKRLFAEGAAEAGVLLKELLSWPEVSRAEVCGSIRRRKETVADIDIVASTEKPDSVMARFVRLDGVERVIEHGETKSEVVLSSGIQCDLRAVSDAEFPFAEHHFTGSREHNVAMRSLAKKAGMKLNEYGLFREGEPNSVSCKDEAEIFGALGISYIEPELRENMG